MAGELEVFDGVASVAIGDTLLTLWKSPARAARIRWVTEVTKRLIARTPDTIVACQFLLPSASPPGLGERGDIRDGLDVVLPKARRLINTPLGDSAWQAIVRGVFKAGLFFLGKAKQVKVAGSADEAFALVGQVAGPTTPDRAALAAALDALHAALA